MSLSSAELAGILVSAASEGVAAFATAAMTAESASTGAAESSGLAASVAMATDSADDGWRRVEAADCSAEMRRSMTWRAEEEASAEGEREVAALELPVALDCKEQTSLSDGFWMRV